MMENFLYYLFFLSVISPTITSYEIIFRDAGIIPMGAIQEVRCKISLSQHEEDNWQPEQRIVLYLNLTDEKSWAIELKNQSLEFTLEEMQWNKEKSFLLEGKVIGTNVLNATSKIIVEDEEIVSSKYIAATASMPLSVIIADRKMNTLFTVIMMAMIIFNTINMGGQLDLQIIKDVFKRPVGPLVGLLSQFLIMPLLSYGIGALLFDSKLFRLGLFVLGCCPGGTGSNFWCLLLNGDINLSITMTFVSTVAALGMMPFWLLVLGSTITDGDLVIPYTQLVSTLLTLVGPIALGMWIRYRFEKGAKIMKAIIVPTTLLTVLFIFTAGIYINLFIFMLMTGKMIAGGFLCAFGGYLFGAVFAWLCRLKPSQITAVSIETAFQNGGIAFVLLKISLPEPYGDLAAVPPVAQLMFTGLPLWVVLAVWKTYQRFCMKSEGNKKETDDNDENDSKSDTPEKTELLEKLPNLPATNV